MSTPPAATSPNPTAESLPTSTDIATSTPTPISPDDLESLVTSLRASLTSSQTLLATQATRLTALTDLETSLNQSRDQLTFLTAAKDAVELQLKDEIRKREVAEENVELLRGQVEQARRGVGLLQKQDKERKRLSTLPAGALGITYPEEEAGGSKRQSMLNRGHRRISSQSDNPLDVSSLPPSTSPNLGAPGPARAGGLRELRLGMGSTPPQPATSPSSVNTGFFDEPLMAPSMAKRHSSAGLSTASSPPSKKDVAAHDEATRLKGELHAVHARLAESEEARMASEACLKALREFMASGAPSTLDDTEISTAELLKGIRLPPLPTDRDPDEPELEGQYDRSPNAVPPTSKSTGGWGFKLWKQPPVSPALSTAVEPPATPMHNLSPPPSINSVTTTPLLSPGEFPSEATLGAMGNNTTPLANFVTGWTKSVSPGTPGEAKGTRKLTNFFSRGPKKDESAGDKALPIRPGEEVDEIGVQEQGVVVVEGGDGLEPSPEISVLVGKGKRESQPTPKTMETALEEEVGTPVKGTSISLDSDDESQGGAKRDKVVEA